MHTHVYTYTCTHIHTNALEIIQALLELQCIILSALKRVSLIDDKPKLSRAHLARTHFSDKFNSAPHLRGGVGNKENSAGRRQFISAEAGFCDDIAVDSDRRLLALGRGRELGDSDRVAEILDLGLCGCRAVGAVHRDAVGASALEAYDGAEHLLVQALCAAHGCCQADQGALGKPCCHVADNHEHRLTLIKKGSVCNNSRCNK